ncbi:hypothetical protein TNCV_2088271 [Trichonephila clavipes]|nr:hypothetical protein TNCV_2088271 [Trichonephila clavipes]
MRIVYVERLMQCSNEVWIGNEEIARKQHERNIQLVKICGLFVDKDKPFVCFHRWIKVGDDGLIEIKCPYSARI